MSRRYARQKKENERRGKRLSAYLDDRLGREERARLEAELAADPALRKELDAIRRAVTLVRSLPQAPVPRNFILPLSAETRPRPARTLARATPFLITATAVAGVLFAVVLTGDLLLGGRGALSLAPLAGSEALPEETESTAYFAEYEGPPDLTLRAEGETTAAPPSALEAPAEEPAPAPGGDADATEKPPSATVTGGAATAEPLDSTPAGVVGEEEIAAPGTAIPPAEVDEERGVNARPGEAAAVPTPAAGAPAEEEERQDAPAQGPASAGSILWLVTEIALGLAFAGLVAATILAWRARRRDTPWHEPPR